MVGRVASLIVALALGLATSVSEPATAQQAPAPGAAPGQSIGQTIEYTLGSGDHIKVKVFGQDDLSGDVFVDGQGMVSLPLIGSLKVGGLLLRQVEEAVANKLKPDYLKNPRVTVEVLNYRPFYIIGEVKNPGSYAFVNGMTIVNAVALAGGYTYRARENNVFITRATDPGKSKQRATHDTHVLPGDVIEVPERFF